MPVPKRKRSHSRKHKRNANKGIAPRAFSSCQTCKEVLVPHSVCKSCGHYKGVKILVTKQERAQLRGTKQKAKAARYAEQAPAAPAEPASQEQA